MEKILYMNETSRNYYLVISKGFTYNICIDIKSNNQRFIDSETLNSYLKFELNKDTIILILNELGINDANISLSDFQDLNFISYKSKLIKINSWRDLYNFIILIP
jgi:hypothetical protein